MGERFTRKDAQRAMERLASALGKPYADASGTVWARVADADSATGYGGYRVAGQLYERRDGRNVAYVGAWHLDYNPTYGGCVIAEMANEGGGESRPMGDRRMRPLAFWEAVAFAMDALAALEVRA